MCRDNSVPGLFSFIKTRIIRKKGDTEAIMKNRNASLEKPSSEEKEQIPVFASERICFMNVSERFVNDYLVMVNDFENVNRFLGGSHKSYTAGQEIAWVREKLAMKAFVFSMIEKETGDFIGNIELMNPDSREGELGIALTAGKQNQGYGTEAVRAFTAYAMDHLGLSRIVLRTRPYNPRAIRVYEKCGFRTYRITDEHVFMELVRELEIYVPKPEDGWFYVKMMTDPATMAYNAPWFPPQGCIPDADKEWEDIQAFWIGKEPERFYAFLRRKADGAFVGDVNYHQSASPGVCDMGIVIYAPQRGKGYGKQGLELLLDHAFRIDGVSCLQNDFETTRGAAYRIHTCAGFRETRREDGIVHLELTREEYFAKR